jgi:hypothetical protein
MAAVELISSSAAQDLQHGSAQELAPPPPDHDLDDELL